MPSPAGEAAREDVLTTESGSSRQTPSPPGPTLPGGKHRRGGLLFLVLLAWFSVRSPWVAAEGPSWIVDRHAFHASVHGRASCLDCHEDVAGRDTHPAAGQVNRNPREDFSSDPCLACHDGVQEEIRAGTHAEGTAARPAVSDACLACHDPH
ncbi:MAG: hypothetical protein K9M82_08670, partial [Deltaproteobacteria bacterium]|nr:hypothetical protein [Deltaproteobacteria bacterium]